MFDDDVWRYLPLGPAPSLVLGTLGAVAAIYVAVVRTRRTRTIAIAMLVLSVVVVLASTARGGLPNHPGQFSWRLGASIRSELHNINRALGLVNVFGNVALFVPIGWLVAVLATRRQVLLGTVCALLLSFSVEMWQMLSGSFGDVDDLVLNGLGGFLGAGAATLLHAFGARSGAGNSAARTTDVPA